jgi:flagellar motor switch protein FliN/FliY
VNGDERNLDVMMNVAFPLSVELGRCSMRLHEILKLASGSLIKLDRSAGAPVDLLINDTVVGRGEIVALDDRYGVCVTELIGRAAAPAEGAG